MNKTLLIPAALLTFALPGAAFADGACGMFGDVDGDGFLTSDDEDVIISYINDPGNPVGFAYGSNFRCLDLDCDGEIGNGDRIVSQYQYSNYPMPYDDDGDFIGNWCEAEFFYTWLGFAWGDVNLSYGAVNVTDFSCEANVNNGSASALTCYGLGANDAGADVDCDGDIDGTDVAIVLGAVSTPITSCL